MPNYYTPYYYQPQPMMPAQQMQPQQQVQQVQQQAPQMQNGGFMLVPSEETVRNYPVAPGNCVTFKIEGKPIVMEKAMGFSQLETPRIDKYRLVKEEVSEPLNLPQRDDLSLQPINNSIERLKSKIEVLEDEIEGIKKKIPTKPATKKREVTEKEVVDDE